MQVPEKNILQHDHDILQIIQAGLPIYVLLLSGNNCLLYSSIGISFKSITKWKWNQNFWQTYWHCI